MCATTYGWCHMVKATEVASCMADSIDSLLPGGWLNVTCGLTACTLGSALGPMLGNEYGRTLHFLKLKINLRLLIVQTLEQTCPQFLCVI